jgi:exopolyphosphatase/guanosine-5'-triphosphate,3'-diphosphate pyrophosphatase
MAVIDIGSTAIRMAIAEVAEDGSVRTLEQLAQAVSLGRDTFTLGSVQRSTIEDCVRVLKIYRRMLQEYNIVRPDQIRVVATSAVREAANRLAFLDRVYIATGFEVEAIDEAEENRITYLGIHPALEADSELSQARLMVMEVGGGSTELLFIQGGDVAYAHTYRLGSLRLRRMLETFRTPVSKSRHIMEGKIHHTIEQIREHVKVDGPVELIALGGDMRFAASQLLTEWNPRSLARIPLRTLEPFTDRMLALSEDEIVQRYRIAFPEAETLGPALLTYVLLARAFKLETILVSNTNLRDGLLQQFAVRESWTDEFRQQILRSAITLARRFDVDEEHARHVAKLSKLLFDQLKDEHQLDAHYEVILQCAALLHEVGLYVRQRSHHKHAMYLINNSEIFGLGKKDLLLTALVARYFRRASPQPTHEGYTDLDRQERIAVAKLAAILRVAVALDDSRSQRISALSCHWESDQLVITIPNVDDLSLEQLAIRQSGSLFEEVFGTSVLLRTAAP